VSALVRADAVRIPLRDESVDLIVTSPPYFALRSYRDVAWVVGPDGQLQPEQVHYAGQIGSEPTPQAYLEALWSVMAECWRVLKPSGSCWINLGDKRAGSGGHNNAGLTGRSVPPPPGVVVGANGHGATRRNAPDRYNQATEFNVATGVGQQLVPGRTARVHGVRPKSKMLLPHRFAIGCEDGLADPEGKGWIVRQDVVWCLSGGARVYARTPTGDRPIMLRDLYRSYQPENVQLWNGQRWTQVLGWSQTPAPDEALELELRSGERIGCTPNHQWPTARGLLRADGVRVGDVIDTGPLPEPEVPREFPDLSDWDMGWFVGLYIAEGSRSGKQVQIAGRVGEEKRYAVLRQIAAALDGNCARYALGGEAETINLSGAIVRGVLDRYVSGDTAKTKRLTIHAWQRCNEFLMGVLNGYLSGDGHYDAKNNRWRLGFTANDEWAADLRTICARLNLQLRLRRCTHVMDGSGFPGWRGEVRFVRSLHRNAKADGEVVAIRQSRARYFYDVGVADEPHLFALASGVLTHNSKLNGLPESVTDRCRDSHEYLFHLTKSERYFSAVDEVREPQDSLGRGRPWSGAVEGSVPTWGTENGTQGLKGRRSTDQMNALNPLGKLPGSVWPIASEPLIVPEAVQQHYDLPDHFAAFSQELPRRIILGWSPSGICTACGEGRRPVVEKEYDAQGRTTNGPQSLAQRHESPGREVRKVEQATITGYACACPTTSAPTHPAVVLDPFAGTGTTCGVARTLGRYGVGLDLSADYLRLARWRIWDSGHFAKTVNRTNRERQGALL
jgi:hypothetical protein